MRGNRFKIYRMKRGKSSAFLTIVVYVAFLTLLIVVLCAGAYYFSMRGYLKKQIEEGNDTYLRQLASSYELFLKNTIDSSMVFIENDGKNVMSLYGESEDEYKRQMYRHLESIFQMTSFMDSVYFYDKNTGMVYLSSGFSYEINDFYDGPWLDSLKEGKAAWQILSARIRKEPAGSEKNVVPIVIRYPFSSLDSPYLYVINLRADELFRYLLRNVYNGQTRSFKVADETGNIFISSDSRDNFKNMNDFPYLQAVKNHLGQEESGSFLADYGDERLIVHVTADSQYHWMYISEMDYSEVENRLKEPLIFIAGVTAVLLAFGLVLCIVFSKRLYRPVKNLLEFVMEETPLKGGGSRLGNNEYELFKKTYQEAFSKNKYLQDTLKQNERVMRKQFFYNLLAKNYYTQEEIDRQLEDLGMEGSVPSVVTIYAVDDWREYLTQFGREEQSLWEYAFENIACEVAGELGTAVFAGIDANRFALIFSGEEKMEGEELELLAASIAERVISALYDFIHYRFSAGIGIACESMYTVNRSFEQAREALAYLEEESGQVLTFRSLQEEKPELTYSAEAEERLIEIVKNGDGAQAGEFLMKMYQEFKESNGGRKEGLPYFTFLIMTALMKTGNELLIPQEEIIGGCDMARLWENAVSVKNEEAVLGQLKTALAGLGYGIAAMRSRVSNSQVLRITQFIRDNYKSPITLADIAEYAGLNQSTVSRLMKQNLKMSTVDYINQVRIEAAMELIQSGTKKVSELSEKTGFHNPHYFIRVFKKITGKTPGAVIEEAWGEDGEKN